MPLFHLKFYGYVTLLGNNCIIIFQKSFDCILRMSLGWSDAEVNQFKVYLILVFLIDSGNGFDVFRTKMVTLWYNAK